MLVGGDLGFPCLVLVLFFVVPVLGFVVRRKWRRSVARREEIKRLLVLASEEAARAELEAFSGYITVAEPTVPKQLQYQCAVCFCPTSTRCARCKAVRYCSGKCQIIHWRQGHKEECRPYTQIHNEEGYETCDSRLEPDGGQFAELVERFPQDYARSSFCGSPHILSEKDNIDHHADDNRVHGSSHTERIGGHQSSDNVSGDLETTYAHNLDQIRGPSSKNSLVNPVDGFTGLAKLDQIKVDCTDGDTHCGSTSSSGWTVDGSNESSFSEPSTPSSSFWEGTIDSKKSRDDVLDDSSQSSSSEAGDASMPNVQSTTHFSCNMARVAAPLSHLQGRDAKTVISDDARRSTMGVKKPNSAGVLGEDSSKGTSKSRNSPSVGSEVSFHMGNDSGSHARTSNKREHDSVSPSASFAYPASNNWTTCKKASNADAGSLPPLGIKRLDHAANGINNASHVWRSGEIGSLSSRATDADLSSRVSKPSVSCAKSEMVDSVRVASSSLAASSPNSGDCPKTSTKKGVDQLRSSKLSHHHQLGTGNQITGRYSYKGLFSYELFVKLYNCNRIGLHPCGLINCGNSCYANAVLQCLAFTPPLTAYLLEGLHSKACQKKGWCFTCEFEILILKAKAGNSPLSPIGILSQIESIGSHLGIGREEDAHEFLRYAIDTMQSICLKESGVDAASGSSEDETTLVGLTFGGYLRSKIKCMKCGGKSECHEKMMDLTVEIEGNIETLEEALRKFTGSEVLDGENKYFCSRCKSHQRAKKRMTVMEAPNVLTIALKRYQSGKFGKLNKTIRFPEILNLAPCMSGTSDKAPVYRLYGVVVHLDVMNAAYSGHYICYVKNIQNQWFKIDDSTVKVVGVESVLTERAYMLLYARCSPRAPRLIRSSIIPRDPIKLKSTSFKLRSHLPGRGDSCVTEPLNNYTNHVIFHRKQPTFEEDSFSDNSSSLCFSEEGSSCTESTRDSTSADEFLDHIFSDFGYNWRNLSDSDTSSTSSSSSPAPMFSRPSPLAEVHRYSSGRPETSGSCINIAESTTDGQGHQAKSLGQSTKTDSMEGKGSVPFLYSKSTEQRRNLGSSNSSSYNKTDSERLVQVNPFDDIKSGLSFRRSTRERTT